MIAQDYQAILELDNWVPPIEWTRPLNPDGTPRIPEPKNDPILEDLDTHRAIVLLRQVRTWVVAQIAINESNPGESVETHDVNELLWMVNRDIAQVGGNQFAKIDLDELRHPALGTISKVKMLVHTKMHQHTSNDWCTTSIKTKVDETGIPRSTVFRVLDELVRDDVLYKEDTKPYYEDNKPVQKPHWYRVNEVEYWQEPPYKILGWTLDEIWEMGTEIVNTGKTIILKRK